MTAKPAPNGHFVDVDFLLIPTPDVRIRTVLAMNMDFSITVSAVVALNDSLEQVDIESVML